MRATALAVDEEGEEEEGEGEEEEEEEEERNGAQRAAMHRFGPRRRYPRIGESLIFLLAFGCLLIVAVASPLHPAPPHRGESRSISNGFHRFAHSPEVKSSLISQFINNSLTHASIYICVYISCTILDRKPLSLPYFHAYLPTTISVWPFKQATS